MTGVAAEFKLENYSLTLGRALSMGYAFQTFSGYLERPAPKVILLRHDVDVSLEDALEMAELEYELQVCSTFFVRLHSGFYNLFDHENINRVKRLIGMGFEIGLHQELWKFTTELDFAVELLRHEKALVETVFGIKVKGLAIHLPKLNPFKISPEFLEETGFKYRPGSEIFNRDAIFISDSNQQWKRYSFADALGQCDKILANIHPVWWMAKITDVAGLINLLKEGK